MLRRRLDFFTLDYVSVKHRDWDLEIKKKNFDTANTWTEF